jgi:hypothetical protein
MTPADLASKGLRVKPLKWVTKSAWHYVADSPLGEYSIKHYNGMQGLWTLYGPGHYGPNNNFPTVEFAQAAAELYHVVSIAAMIESMC